MDLDFWGVSLLTAETHKADLHTVFNLLSALSMGSIGMDHVISEPYYGQFYKGFVGK